MKKHILHIILFGLTLCACLSSCEYKDLETAQHGDIVPVKIVMIHDSIDFVPSLNRVLMLPVNDSIKSFIMRDIKDSLYVALKPTRYIVMSYNNDSEINRYSNYADGKTDICISTPVSAVNEFANDSIVVGKVYDYPDRVAVTEPDTFDVFDFEGQRKVLFLKEATQNVVIRISGIEHLEYVQSAVICVNNCSLEYDLSQNKITGREGNIKVQCNDINSDKNSLLFRFNTFGFNGRKVYMCLCLKGMNFIHYLHFDVNKDMLTTGDKGKKVIVTINRDFDVRDIIPKGNGFSVTTDDWETRWQDLPL